MQRKAADGAQRTPAVPPIVHDVLRSPGQPLDAATRSFFEPRFGMDFSAVRVHTDQRAAESARAVNALAYTVGRDVVFGAESYTPHTGSGQRLMAHELTHVVQQRNSNAALQSKLTVGAADDAYEQEANEIAERVNNAHKQVNPTHRVAQASASLQRQSACGQAAFGPQVDCTRGSNTTACERFLFAVNTADFLTPAEQIKLEMFADTIATGDIIEIYGSASTDGDPSFNEILSCERALKAQTIIQSILTAKGVLADVDVFMSGANPDLDPAEQRSVVITGIIAPVSPGQSPVFSGCDTSQISMVNDHIRDARMWVNDAVPKIHDFVKKPYTRGWRKPDDTPDDRIIRDALRINFHTDEPVYLVQIARNFDHLSDELMSALDIECVSSCEKPNHIAYFIRDFDWSSRRRDFYICPLWFNCNNDLTMVSTFIHEVAHQSCNAVDKAYEWQSAEYGSLSAREAIWNADSYAVTARQIYYRGSNGPGAGASCLTP